MRLTFCALCGCDDPGRLEHHHVTPRSQGGDDSEANLLTVCSSCHGKVHGMQRRSEIGALTRAGIAKARQRGVRLGPPPTLAPEQVAAVLLALVTAGPKRSRGGAGFHRASTRTLARQLGAPRSTVHRVMQALERRAIAPFLRPLCIRKV